ncbi:ATP synthase subunit b [Sphingomonas antarctica]|uniref:F0F1 ATP synthase subunit B family protein n=1 Tax=Sphingomonas antarctica TaxID=2040274 RepID=UPI0039EAD7EC
MADVGASSLPRENLAMTEAHGGVEHVEPTLLGLGAEGWVYVGLTIFLLITIFVVKAPKKITDALDERIAETKRTLDEAKALRAEAEAMLADAKAKAAASAGDAQSIVNHAEAEAKHLIEEAKAKATDLTQRRQKMAEDKIAAAERAAIADVRARAASAAAGIAAQVIRQSHDATADAALVDTSIKDLQRA